MKAYYNPKRWRASTALILLLMAVFLTSAFGQSAFFDGPVADPFELGLAPHTGGSMFPTLADIDSDGDLDLFVGEKWNYSSGCFMERSLDFYRNVGNSDCPDFQFEASYPFGIPEEATNIKFVDINGDGLLDLFGRKDCVSPTVEGAFICILNTGTETEPVFDAGDILYDPFVLDPEGVTGASVATLAFADLNGDGTYDAFINGRTNGHFLYQENIGTPTAPNFKAREADPFGLSLPAMPNGPIYGALADWDCDGDIDMMNTIWDIDIASDIFNVYFHENKYNELGLVQFEPGVLLDPSFIVAQGDLDGDGDLDAMAFQYYARNISSFCATLPEAAFSFDHTEDGMQYAFINESTAQSTECNPVQWFWDFGDGSTSTEEHPTHVFPEPGGYEICLIVEDIAGADTLCQFITGARQQLIQEGLRLYPNPAPTHLYLELAEGFSLKEAEVEVFDALGQAVQRTRLGFAGVNAAERIDIAGLPAGMYTVKITDGARFFVGEFVKTAE